jgi:Transglutaminase-like enzymes, putative cysteine proteases
MSEPESRRYRVRHRTSYRYDEVLEAGYNRGLLRPRETPTQQVLSFEVTSTPAAEQLSEHSDYFGNPSLYLETRSPVTELVVEAVSEVQVQWPAPDLAGLDAWSVAEASAVLAAELDPVEHTEFTWPSPLVALDATLGEYAAQLLAPERRLGTALADLLHAIHRDFSYTSGSTSVSTTLAEVLATREGVCQDFAQLTVGCLRWAGLPARYVSGHLETAPPPGRPKLRGADATHAWASVRCPDGNWVDLDPTNDQFADSRYIVTAWGRDYSDVSPLRGVVFTEAGSSTLSVEVDVEPL